MISTPLMSSTALHHRERCSYNYTGADESDNSIEIITETLLPPPRLPGARGTPLASDLQHCSRRHATITQLWGNANKVNNPMLINTYIRQPHVHTRSATWGFCTPTPRRTI